MIKLVDLNYHSHSKISNPAEVLEIQKASIGFVEFIKERLSIHLIKHMDFEGERNINGVRYSFFKSKNKFWYIPFKTHAFIKKEEPDIVLIQGLVFPLQLITLKVQLGKRTKLIVQHHGEKPFTGIKKMFQKIADRYVSFYLFTSVENAEEFIKNKIISGKNKCIEILEASTFYVQRNKRQCRQRLCLINRPIFLWVGRLNLNKDPFTLLNAFEKYLSIYPEARLYIIYQTEDLLQEMQKRLEENCFLKNSVILKGEVDHSELENWFNAADFYISASHKEGSGYALIEAMACGSIPIVTSIPSFKKITANGKFGFLFEPGNPESLLKVLLNLKNIDKEQLSICVADHFNESLSFKSIAGDLFEICEKLMTK
ncbi:MAG: glycosyltransferase family 4 protein [Ginsengibacter sp.]